MIRKSSAPPCYMHMTSPEASVAKKKKQKKNRLSRHISPLHLKADLQDRDAFHRVISGKGHMCAYKINPESSAFVPKLSPNGAIVLPGQLAPWLQLPSPRRPGSLLPAGPGPGQPLQGPGQSGVSTSNLSHGEKRPAGTGTVGASSLLSAPRVFLACWSSLK